MLSMPEVRVSLVAPSKTGPDQYQVSCIFLTLMSPSLTAPSSAHEKNVFSQRWPFWEYIEVALKEVPADSTDEWKDGIANYKISQLRTEAEQYFSGTDPSQKNYAGENGKRHLQTCNVLNYLKWKNKGKL